LAGLPAKLAGLHGGLGAVAVNKTQPVAIT
jgi:hypothetical protein